MVGRPAQVKEEAVQRPGDTEQDVLPSKLLEVLSLG